jgi:hypothetical protein
VLVAPSDNKKVIKLQTPQIFNKGNQIADIKISGTSTFHKRTQAEQLKSVGRTEVGSHSGRGEMICRNLYVNGTGFKTYLTLMMMIIIIIAATTTTTTIIIITIFTMTKMIMVFMINTMMIYLFRAADNNMSISKLHMENKLNRLNKIFQSTHKQVKA